MHHQGREYDVERFIGEREPFDHPNLELDWRAALSGFRAGASDLLGAGINATDAARSANAVPNRKRQRSRAAAHIQRLLSWL
jgi:hypothetical protein